MFRIPGSSGFQINNSKDYLIERALKEEENQRLLGRNPEQWRKSNVAHGRSWFLAHGRFKNFFPCYTLRTHGDSNLDPALSAFAIVVSTQSAIARLHYSWDSRKCERAEPLPPLDLHRAFWFSLTPVETLACNLKTTAQIWVKLAESLSYQDSNRPILSVYLKKTFTFVLLKKISFAVFNPVFDFRYLFVLYSPPRSSRISSRITIGSTFGVFFKQYLKEE